MTGVYPRAIRSARNGLKRGDRVERCSDARRRGVIVGISRDGLRVYVNPDGCGWAVIGKMNDWRRETPEPGTKPNTAPDVGAFGYAI